MFKCLCIRLSQITIIIFYNQNLKCFPISCPWKIEHILLARVEGFSTCWYNWHLGSWHCWECGCRECSLLIPKSESRLWFSKHVFESFTLYIMIFCMCSFKILNWYYVKHKNTLLLMSKWNFYSLLAGYLRFAVVDTRVIIFFDIATSFRNISFIDRRGKTIQQRLLIGNSLVFLLMHLV